MAVFLELVDLAFPVDLLFLDEHDAAHDHDLQDIFFAGGVANVETRTRSGPSRVLRVCYRTVCRQ